MYLYPYIINIINRINKINTPAENKKRYDSFKNRIFFVSVSCNLKFINC